jgi:hypothetical protein
VSVKENVRAPRACLSHADAALANKPKDKTYPTKAYTMSFLYR